MDIKTFYHFSIKNETQNTMLFFENRKIEHAFHFFVQTKRVRKLIILIIQIIRVFRCS